MDIFEDLIDEGDKFASVDTGTGKQLSDLVRKLRVKSNKRSRMQS